MPKIFGIPQIISGTSRMALGHGGKPDAVISAASEKASGFVSTETQGSAFGGATTIGEKVVASLAKFMLRSAENYLKSHLSDSNPVIKKLGETFIDTVFQQFEKAAQARIQQGGQGLRQGAAAVLGVPVGSATPPPVYGPPAPSRYMPSAYENRGAGWRWDNTLAQWVSDKPYGPPAPPPQTTMYQRLLGRVGTYGATGLESTLGEMGQAVRFFTAQHGLGSFFSGLGSAQDTSMQVTMATAGLQKMIGNLSPGWKGFHDQIAQAGKNLGALPTTSAGVASLYMPAALRSSGADIQRILGFSSAYGMDPTAWASQMATAAGSLGYVGGARGGMGLNSYQSLLSMAYANSTGLAKMPDFATGFQDLARLMQANTVTSPNAQGPLQFYSKLNQSGIAGLSGTAGAAVLGQLNQGIVNAPNASPGVQTAYYQALGGARGISPAQLKFMTEQGLSGPAFQKVLSWSNKEYAGFNPMDKLYAQSQLFGLNMHQTQALLGAVGQGRGFSMQGFNSLLSQAGTNINRLDDSQINLLAQLATGKTGSVAAQMLQQHIGGSHSLQQLSHMSQQQLARMIVGSGTVQSEDVQTQRSLNAWQKSLQDAADALHPFTNWLKQAMGDHPFMTVAGATGANVGLNLAGGWLARKMIGGLRGVGAGGGGTPAAPPGSASRLGAAARFLGAGAAAVGGGIAANAAMDAIERATIEHSTFKGYHFENPMGNIPVLGSLLGGDILVPNGKKFDFWRDAINPFTAMHVADDSPLHGGGRATTGAGAHVFRGGGAGIIPTVQAHRNAVGGALSDHLAASTTRVQETIHQVLNPYAPLPDRILHTLRDDLSTFITAFGRNLDTWMRAALGSVAGMPGGTGGTGGTTGGYALPGGGMGLSGKNTFSRYSFTPYGHDSGWWGNYHDIEKGNVYSMGGNAPVYLPTGGKFDARYSTQYSDVIDLPNGQAMSFMHLATRRFKNGQYLPAGTQIGNVLPWGSKSMYYGTTYQGGLRHGFVNDPGVMEFGVFSDPQHAFMRDSGGDMDPNAFLASLGSGYSGGFSAGGSLAGLPQQYRAMYMAAGAKYHVPWQFLAKQGLKESSWRPGIVSADGGYGIAQFTGATGYQYLGGPGWQQRALNPALSIDAQGRYMRDLLNREGGNLWAAARDYNGSGPAAVAYANSLVGGQGPAGGGAGIIPGSGTAVGEITVHLIYPNGQRQDVTVPMHQRYAGVSGIHVSPTHRQGAIGHPAHRKAPRR